MRSHCRRDAGTVTAEFAVVLPALVLVFAALLGGIALGGARIRVIDAAATAARSLARGDSRDAALRLVAASGIGRLAATSTADGMVCVTIEADVPVFGARVALPISSRSCALSSSGGIG